MTELKTTQPRILLVGDSCVDKYHYGVCDRISPEAPVPILRHLYTEEYPGMAMNVRENLAGLGLLPALFITQQEKITKERYVDVKTRQQFLRVDVGENAPVTLEVEGCDVSPYDALVISDYDKGTIGYAFAQKLTRHFSGPVFIDSKKPDLSCFWAKNTFLKLNEAENNAVTKYPSNCEVIVTRGERGASHGTTSYPTEPLDVFDASGAGDTFFAAFIVSYLRHHDMGIAIDFANYCTRIAASKPGTYAVTLGDLGDDILF